MTQGQGFHRSSEEESERQLTDNLYMASLTLATDVRGNIIATNLLQHHKLKEYFQLITNC